jgi:ADP-ribose pyrophosphatase
MPSASFKWNDIDGAIDRRSHLGKYDVIGGMPRNPVGRTGVSGRGLLGRWGPNHAGRTNAVILMLKNCI